MSKEQRFCYFINGKKIDVKASRLTCAQIADHIIFDRGYLYSKLIDLQRQPRTRRVNALIFPPGSSITSTTASATISATVSITVSITVSATVSATISATILATASATISATI